MMMFFLLILPFIFFEACLFQFVEEDYWHSARLLIATIAACIPALLYVYLSGAL